jgi:hypothetical protein
MTFFKKKTEEKKPDVRQVRELTVSEVQVVSGGLNPQPLPPRWIKL